MEFCVKLTAATSLLTAQIPIFGPQLDKDQPVLQFNKNVKPKNSHNRLWSSESRDRAPLEDKRVQANRVRKGEGVW